MDNKKVLPVEQKLKDLFSLNNIDKKHPEGRFSTIARELMENYCIKKGDKVYTFRELEFYLYCDEHKDIITYPRNADAGDWFFHASGVDICFDSKYGVKTIGKKNKILSGSFGGILIRGLDVYELNSVTKVCVFVKEIDSHPQLCCYELFDRFSAIHTDETYPIMDSKSTYTLTGQNDKFSFQKEPIERRLNFSNIETKCSELNDHFEFENKSANIDLNGFKDWMKKPYRYCYCDTDTIIRYRDQLEKYGAKNGIQYSR